MIKIPNLTTNYNLNKPLGSEKINVDVLNENMDILDTTTKSISIKTDISYIHSQSAHARTDATKTENSDVNGNIKINGTETIVYMHPTGTNPHGTTKIDIELENVDNTSDMNKPISTAQQKALNDKVDKVPGKGLSTNDYTTAEKNKLANIANGAEINQNTFSNVKVGSVILSADAKTDTLELVAGTNVTITPDANSDKITISSASASLNGMGVAATATELNFVKGVTSNIQTQLNGKALSSHNHNNNYLNVSTNNNTYTTLVDFWTFCNSLMKNSASRIVAGRAALQSFVPNNGWYRYFVSCQNLVGNGQYDVNGSIMLDGGSGIYYGAVTGGISNANDLVVKWYYLGVPGYYNTIAYTSNEPMAVANGLIWIG